MNTIYFITIVNTLQKEIYARYYPYDPHYIVNERTGEKTYFPAKIPKEKHQFTTLEIFGILLGGLLFSLLVGNILARKYCKKVGRARDLNDEGKAEQEMIDVRSIEEPPSYGNIINE